MKYIFLFFILLLTTGCNDSEVDYSLQKEKNTQLKIQLTECTLLQNGLLMTDGQKEEIKKKETLNELDYEYILTENTKLPITLKECKSKLKTPMNKKMNSTSTGTWGIKRYIDKFGEYTQNQYITNINLIRGTFSNTATKNSKLNVKFLITDSQNISILLYEYARNNPLKSVSKDYYQVHVKDRNGNEFSFSGKLSVDRINILTESEKNHHYGSLVSLAKSYSGVKRLHKILMDGGTASFRIDEGNYRADYNFKINADSYKDAYSKLN